MRLRSRLNSAALIAVAFSSACGGSTPAAAPAPSSPQQPVAIAQPAPTPAPEPTATPYFALISTDWVGRHLRVSDRDVAAWAVDPANAKLIAPNIRHILIRLDSDAKPKEVAAATKRADAALARIKHGEDFAKVAEEVSEDYGTQKVGGVLPGVDLSMYVEPFRVAAEALAPGEVTKKLVRTQYGLHIIKKEKVDDDSKRAAYGRNHAKATALGLAEVIATGLKRSDDPSRTMNDAIASVLDEKATADEARPMLAAFPASAEDNAAEDPACAQARSATLANPDTAGMAPLERDNGFVVTKMLSATFRAETAPHVCLLGAMSAAQIRKLIGQLKAQQDAQQNQGGASP